MFNHIKQRTHVCTDKTIIHVTYLVLTYNGFCLKERTYKVNVTVTTITMTIVTALHQLSTMSSTISGPIRLQYTTLEVGCVVYSMRQ